MRLVNDNILLKLKKDLYNIKRMVHGRKTIDYLVSTAMRIIKKDDSYAIENYLKHIDQSLCKIEDDYCGVDDFQKNIHKIWVTNTENPSFPLNEYVNRIIKESEEYSNLGWQYNVWVQNSVLDNMYEKFFSESKFVYLRSIEDDLSPGKWLVLYESFVNDRKFPFAVDVLRLKILSEYGGAYFDMGAFLNDIKVVNEIALFDYSFVLWETMFYQNSVIFARKDSDLIRILNYIIENPCCVTKELIGTINGINEGRVFSGLILTVVLLCYCNNSTVLPLLANGDVLYWSAQQSWYTKSAEGITKFGNAYIPESNASFFSEDILKRYNGKDIFGLGDIV